MKKQKNIRFSWSGTSRQNGAAKSAIKIVVTIAGTILMHASLRCPEETFSIYLWPNLKRYSVHIYKHIPDMQSDLSTIEIYSISRYVTMS